MNRYFKPHRKTRWTKKTMTLDEFLKKSEEVQNRLAGSIIITENPVEFKVEAEKEVPKDKIKIGKQYRMMQKELQYRVEVLDVRRDYVAVFYLDERLFGYTERVLSLKLKFYNTEQVSYSENEKKWYKWFRELDEKMEECVDRMADTKEYIDTIRAHLPKERRRGVVEFEVRHLWNLYKDWVIQKLNAKIDKEEGL